MNNSLRAALAFAIVSFLAIITPVQWFTNLVTLFVITISLFVTLLVLWPFNSLALSYSSDSSSIVARIVNFTFGTFLTLTGQAWIVSSYTVLVPLWVSWIAFFAGLFFAIASVIKLKRSTVTPYPTESIGGFGIEE